ncbi:MAG: FAD-dependent oxidoreductase, partial [Terriglobia bacterium]
MGSYNTDCHNAQRFVTPAGTVQNEGDTQAHTLPYQIAYRVLLPRQVECENLLVAVCCSATHIAYGTLREEPAFMVMGHAAGVAAKLAVESRKAVQKIDRNSLQNELRKQGAVLTIPAGYPVITRR